MTLFAEELSAAVRAARPDLLVSVSPSITSFSDINFNAEWPEWQDDGLFDEYVVQAYRDNLSSFTSILPGQLAPFGLGGLDELVVGLRANGTGANTPFADLEGMINATRSSGAAGHAIFYSRGVRDEYGSQLTAYYDVEGEGHADNPLFGYQRADPVDGVLESTNTWGFDVPAGGGYRLVAEIEGRWREVSAGYFPAGERDLTVFGATRVELLEDRRQIEPADFNGDGSVDAADYTIWRDTRGSLTDLRADANGDGVVNEMDYDLWAGGFAFDSSAASSTVPEPTSLALLIVTLTNTTKRRNDGR